MKLIDTIAFFPACEGEYDLDPTLDGPLHFRFLVLEHKEPVSTR